MRLTTPDGAEYTVTENTFNVDHYGRALLEGSIAVGDLKKLDAGVTLYDCKLDVNDKHWDGVTLYTAGFTAPTAGRIVLDVWMKWQYIALPAPP